MSTAIKKKKVVKYKHVHFVRVSTAWRCVANDSMKDVGWLNWNEEIEEFLYEANEYQAHNAKLLENIAMFLNSADCRTVTDAKDD